MDIEKLITEKRREIENEKVILGLSTPPSESNLPNEKENVPKLRGKNRVTFPENRVLCERDENAEVEKEKKDNHYDLEKEISPALDRYIRRYLGLPVMLKAGEYSPNNPLIRSERSSGDVLLGLGEYERRRNTLRKLRQQQYKEYLDQQAKKKKEDKERAERERREWEAKERERDERQLLERDRYSPERRKPSIPTPASYSSYINKVDSGVQVSGVVTPLSVAVQTDDADIYTLRKSSKWQLTQAERELSPRTVIDNATDRHANPQTAQLGTDKLTECTEPRDTGTGCEAREARRGRHSSDERLAPWLQRGEDILDLNKCGRRRSYGDFNERMTTPSSVAASILDGDAIHLRNLQAEKEAAARRRDHQQQLRDQILDQRRLRDQRAARERMLEQAEMRRLEEQLRMLKVAQEREVGRQQLVSSAMKESASDYEHKRKELQKEIDLEHQKLLRATVLPKPRTFTSKSDTNFTKQPSQLPFHYPSIDKNQHSKEIPDTTMFSSNYDVDTYLRKNLNFDISSAKSMRIDSKIGDMNIDKTHNVIDGNINKKQIGDGDNIESPKTIRNDLKSNDKSVERDEIDTLPIPILRYSSNTQIDTDKSNLSEAMHKIDDKWKVPAVQKNILKTIPNDGGKKINILTQLGSIRRQLQLEQLKLDNMVSN